jgi:hypothetical protein
VPEVVVVEWAPWAARWGVVLASSASESEASSDGEDGDEELEVNEDEEDDDGDEVAVELVEVPGSGASIAWC